MNSVFRGQPTRGEIERNERKGERGVCRIQKRCTGSQGYQTVGSGSLIKHQIDPQWRSKYLIVTTSKVFQEDFDARNYRVDFVKSRSKLKTFELDGAIVGRDILQNSSGLAVIPLDSHSSVFRHGLFRKKCGILKHRPFEVESCNNVDSAYLNGLCCHMVADESSSNSFGVKPHELTRNSSGRYAVSNLPSSHFPHGAAILRRVNNKWSAVGVLSSSTADTFLPIWLTTENFSNFIRTGEAIITSREVDPVVHLEQSSRVESLQSPPVDSEAHPTANGTQNRSRDISTGLDQPRNGLHAGQEQTLETGMMNNNQPSREEGQNEPDLADSGTLNGGSAQPRITSEFRREAINGQEQTLETGMMNNNQHSREEEQNEPDSTESGTLNGGSTQLRITSEFRREAINGQVLYIGDVVDNATLMDELARCLDRQYKVLNYWKHLAFELHIPADVQMGFEIYFELSPTVHLFQFLSTNDPHLTTGKLRVALKDIHRNDLIQELKDITDTAAVVDVFNSKPSLLDSIALKLDSAKKPVGNWISLARKLISTGQLFKEFEAQLHSSENPTALLFRYLRTTEKFSKLTVGDLKEHLENIARRDVLVAIASVGDGDLLADVFSPDSDLLNSVSNLLNKKSPGVRNWRNLAYKFGVPNKVYEEFDPDTNGPRRRPTKMMLEWLRSEHPNMTVDELRTAVKKIGRADALEILDGYLFSSQGAGNAASLESTPREQKQRIKAKGYQTGSDEVDSELHSLPVQKISPSKSEPETRLSAAVTELPLRVYSKVCLKLNIRRLLFDDFRMLGERVGLTRDEVEYLGQQDNPTDHILTKWSSTGQATVGKLIDFLGEEGLERNDVIEILNVWVNQ